MEPTGWTKQPSAHSGFGPRTCPRGRRAMSTNATVVSAASTTPAATMTVRWRRVRSLHRFFEPMASTLRGLRRGAGAAAAEGPADGGVGEGGRCVVLRDERVVHGCGVVTGVQELERPAPGLLGLPVALLRRRPGAP